MSWYFEIICIFDESLQDNKKKMKRISFNRSLFILWILLLGAHVVQAQVIDNKGNRNQTYPFVIETNPIVVEMINQVDTVNTPTKSGLHTTSMCSWKSPQTGKHGLLHRTGHGACV